MKKLHLERALDDLELIVQRIADNQVRRAEETARQAIKEAKIALAGPEEFTWNSDIGAIPHGSTVVASYFDSTVGEWIVKIFVAKRPKSPFTHWALLTRPGEVFTPPPPLVDGDPIDAIKQAMAERGMQNKDLYTIFGNKSRTSEILRRKRWLNIEHARLLNIKLGIPLEKLVQIYELENGNGK